MPLVWDHVLRNYSTCPYASAQMGSFVLSNNILSVPASLSDRSGTV